MFETVADAYYEACAAEHDMPTADEMPPDMRDDWIIDDATLEAWIAADPDRRRTPAEVIASGETQPITADLIWELAGIDPRSLDPAGQVGLARAWSRVENYAAARTVAAVAVMAGPDPVSDDDPAAFAACEIGAALRLGDGQSSRLVHVARRLHTGLVSTAAAAATGDLSFAKVAALAELTAALDDDRRGEVERSVLSQAPGRTPAQHAAAVRRAVERVDPEGAAERRRQAKADVVLIRTHHDAGMGELFARMTSEDLETVWLAADAWARGQKSAGDERNLDQLRVAALVEWGSLFLTTGSALSPDEIEAPIPPPVDPQTGESATYLLDGRTGELVEASTTDVDSGAPHACPPTRHGRPLSVNLVWDMPSFLGLCDNPGEIMGSDAMIPAGAMRELCRDAEFRRLLIDPLTGHLLDLSPRTYRPSAALADWIAARDGHPTTPTAGVSRAGSGDLDHIVQPARGGQTVRDNLHSPTRRWHRAKTLGGWRVRQNDDRTWTWTSPTGRDYTTAPHDYRLGP